MLVVHQAQKPCTTLLEQIGSGHVGEQALCVFFVQPGERRTKVAPLLITGQTSHELFERRYYRIRFDGRAQLREVFLQGLRLVVFRCCVRVVNAPSEAGGDVDGCRDAPFAAATERF